MLLLNFLTSILTYSWIVLSRDMQWSLRSSNYKFKGLLGLGLHFNILMSLKIVSEYDQEIPESQTAYDPMAPRRTLLRSEQTIQYTPVY